MMLQNTVAQPAKETGTAFGPTQYFLLGFIPESHGKKEWWKETKESVHNTKI